MTVPRPPAAAIAPGGTRSFGFGHLAFRALWNATWLLLAAWTPPPLHAWRRLLLRLFGARMGAGTRVYGSARVWYPPNLAMGDRAVVGPQANIYCMAPITIGRDAVISQYSHLLTGTHDVHSPAFDLLCAPLVIGDHAWIAAGAVVGPGVTVGEGAVLGAWGVAFKDLAPWTIHAGNPARPLGQRDRAWWDTSSDPRSVRPE